MNNRRSRLKDFLRLRLDFLPLCGSSVAERSGSRDGLPVSPVACAAQPRRQVGIVAGVGFGRGSCSGPPGSIRNHLRQLPDARPASETEMQSEKPLSQGLASCNNRTRGHLKRDAEQWRRRARGACVGRG